MVENLRQYFLLATNPLKTHMGPRGKEEGVFFNADFSLEDGGFVPQYSYLHSLDL